MMTEQQETMQQTETTTSQVQQVIQPVSETGKQQAISKHRGFQPGQSGNPAGRPPKDRTVIDIIREKLKTVCVHDKDRRTWALVLAEAELKGAINDPQARKNLFDRLFGRAVEQMNLNQTGEVILRVQYDDDSHNASYVNSIEAESVRELPPKDVSIPQLGSAPGQETPPTPQGDRQETGG